MEIIFIRHGQGIHNTNIPDRLNLINPTLTERGKEQVFALKDVFNINEDDVFFVSPTIRTIETTNILTSGLLHIKKYITPLVGPRMFPMPPNAESNVTKCDWVYPNESIRKDHPEFSILDVENVHLWTKGINTTDEITFFKLGSQMISLIQEHATESNRAFVVAHDGTITSYRVLLGEKGLSRADFLGEAGWHRAKL